MSLPLFEISEDIEVALFSLIKAKGYVVRSKGEPKKINESLEQNWSIVISEKEVFLLSIVKTKIGKKILIFGPLHDKKHKQICEILSEEICRLGGKRIKNLSDYL